MRQYIVQPGDSLYLISQKYNIIVERLIQINHIKSPYMIFPGQVLNIPSANSLATYSNGFPPVKIRDIGPLVILIQIRLDKANFYKGKLDGVFGPSTHKSVSQFQQDRKLPPTGQVDLTTWRYLLDETNCFNNAPPFKAHMVLSGLLLALSTDKKIYKSGEIIHLSLTMINLSEKSITLNYNTSQRYDFKISTPSGQILWRYSDNKDITQAPGTLAIKPGQMIRYIESYRAKSSPNQYQHVSCRNLAKQLELLELQIGIKINPV